MPTRVGSATRRVLAVALARNSANVGFSRDMLSGLVVAGLATVVAETLKADGPTIKIERVRITDAGRRAIEG